VILGHLGYRAKHHRYQNTLAYEELEGLPIGFECSVARDAQNSVTAKVDTLKYSRAVNV
jgi:hypothetical protein